MADKAMGDWMLRRAEPQDALSLAHCVHAAYRQYLPRIGKPPGPMLADYAEEIAHHQVWVAEEQGKIIGGLVLIPQADHMLLDNIAVDPAHQGRGLGRALLELADAESSAQGYQELRLYTHETMTENIDLYARIGWIETHRGEQGGYQRVFMRKPLLSQDTGGP
jgi:ribosomal protein S18 acetylase RimI-like enzyme